MSLKSSIFTTAILRRSRPYLINHSGLPSPLNPRPSLRSPSIYLPARTSHFPAQNRPIYRHLQSSLTGTVLLTGVSLLLGTLFVWDTYTSSDDEEVEDESRDTEKLLNNAADMPITNRPEDVIPEARPGNLTPEQDAKLRELWYKVGELIGLDIERFSLDSTFGRGEVDDNASVAPSSTKKKSRFGRFGRSKEQVDDNDKHGSSKEFKKAISEMSHDELRNAFWDFSKCDDPDANVCRYLRARKWNVQDALVMLVSTIYWRQRVMHLDDDVMFNGEEAAIRAVRGEMTGTGGLSKKMAHDMLDQLRVGKSFIHGVDKEGRPLCFVRVRLHHGGEHSAESLERLTVYMIETARFMLDPPKLETAVLVFDMSGFSLANMDYTPLKFMIKVFEANYPESLGAILVHRAPWVFQSVWSVIKGWLDPVVASKIHFTKDTADVGKFIDMENIPRDMGGEEDWEYEYPEPIDGENAVMADRSTRMRLETERKDLLDQFETATMEWVMQNGVNDSEHRAKRKAISKKLSDNYWQLDPYVRSRSMHDRLGIIGPKGEFNPYPKELPSWSGGAEQDITNTLSEKSPLAPYDRPSEKSSFVNGTSSVNGTSVNGTPDTSVSAAPSERAREYPTEKPFQRTNGLGVPNWTTSAPVSRSKDSDAQSVHSVETIYYDAMSELD